MAHSTSTTSDAYSEFQAELEELLRFKWIASEKAGHDIGFEQALRQWSASERPDWRKKRREARP